jgi:hypothetical protein
LTTTAIDNDPNLKEAAQQLAGISDQCSLGSIATQSPFITDTQTCPPFITTNSSGISKAASAFLSAYTNKGYFGQCHNTFSGVNPTFVSLAPTADQRLLVCQAAISDLAAQQSATALSKASDRFKTFEQKKYNDRCLGQKMHESFSYQFAPNEYHYTLHYYDQAGNLVETVPPAGVHALSDGDAANLDVDPSGTVLPNHTLISRYQYDSSGQVIFQDTPDSGWKRFWYDDDGQLRLSQTAQQKADERYAYVKYDAQLQTTLPKSISTDCCVVWQMRRFSRLRRNCPNSRPNK